MIWCPASTISLTDGSFNCRRTSHGRWAIEIKRGLSARPEKGFFIACEDIKPNRRFVMNSGTERYQISESVETIGLKDLAAEVAAL